MVQRCYQSPFHFQQSYLLAEGSCNDFDSISCTCLYKKLVLVSNPVFFAPLWHSHSLNASRHTTLLELKTISAFSATSYYFDSLLSKFHLANPKLGKMCLCFTAVNSSSWLHNCQPKPHSPLYHVPYSGSSSQNTESHCSVCSLFPSCPFIWCHLQLYK